jgi:alpha-L-rhamnosidase
MPRRGRFACSDERLNRLHRAIDWTIRDNTMSVTTDCPQRDERQGWLGDGHVIAETVLHHFDPTAFYHKWLQDIRETQEEGGNRWGACAPPWHSCGRQRKPHRYREQGDLVWSAAGTLIPWEVYLHHGDRSVLRESAPAIFAHARYLAGRPDFPLIDAVDIGDHLFVGWKEMKDPTDFVLLGTAFALEQTRIAGRAAELQNDPVAAGDFRALAEQYRQALAENFCDQTSGGFGSQTADALALQFSFAPDRDRTLAHLVADIEARGGHLATGIVGTRYLLEALSANGRFDMAWRVVTAEGYPGWMEMLKNGATTITERWTYWGNWEMNSHNHPALGSVGAWLFRWLAGIRLDPEAPVYRRFLIAPELPEGLDWAEAELDTVRGRVASRWERNGQTVHLHLTVPPGAEATVRLPGNGAVTRRIGCGEHELKGRAV